MRNNVRQIDAEAGRRAVVERALASSHLSWLRSGHLFQLHGGHDVVPTFRRGRQDRILSPLSEQRAVALGEAQLRVPRAAERPAVAASSRRRRRPGVFLQREQPGGELAAAGGEGAAGGVERVRGAERELADVRDDGRTELLLGRGEQPGAVEADDEQHGRQDGPVLSALRVRMQDDADRVSEV